MQPKYRRPDCEHCEFIAHLANRDVYKCTTFSEGIIVCDKYGAQPEKRRYNLANDPKLHEILVLFDLLGGSK